MLASIFGKVTASLGKTYVFSGLLPAGIFLLAIGTFYTSFAGLLQFGQQRLSVTEAWKSLSAAGAAWIALGFVLYAVRTWFFGLFEIIPVSGFGRALLFRRLAKRGRADRELERHERTVTACNWILEWKFNPEKVGGLPEWLRLESPSLEALLAASQLGRETVRTVERTVGGALSIRTRQVDVIVSGIFALYRLVSDPRWGVAHPAAAAEVEAWQQVSDGEAAQGILEIARDDVLRRVDKAFAARGTFGDKHYVFPTALGDLFSALDDYGENRYGIDTSTLWDRVWWILPREVKADVSDARLSVETLINLIVALLLVGGVVGASQIASCGFGYDGMGACVPIRAGGWIAACWVLVLLAYRGACFAMEVLATKIASLVDCYRLAALSQLGFSPKTVGDERDLLEQLRAFFTQAKPLKMELAIAAAKSEGKSEKSDKDEASEKSDKDKDDKDGKENREAKGEKEGKEVMEHKGGDKENNGKEDQKDDKVEKVAPADPIDEPPAPKPSEGEEQPVAV
ncbi:hypothetical protein [Bradyrhizobium sp. AS23.2]|uniref:hypothetical protein n=1 Tax=Bradyrhizobium sp. AS23.2 TaxID=1680155 RepID=UPI00093C32BB|nr:hypothetical protein [Bradyrhizobium sp. AS23.2]OKO85180.1 hypothetical protein AC630_06640 [Bradyrhizobium sp. AS23.2]